MEIFAVKILDNIDRKLFNSLVLQFDSKKQKIIRSMKNSHVAAETLTSALLIQHIIKTKLGLNKNKIVFGKNKYGKPNIKTNQYEY